LAFENTIATVHTEDVGNGKLGAIVGDDDWHRVGDSRFLPPREVADEAQSIFEDVAMDPFHPVDGIALGIL
jgi:hypothetical protein